jgi:DNA-binding NarL/FixJ family response regulator
MIGRHRLSETVPVLVVEDEAIVRQWIRAALSETEFEVVGEAKSADETIRLVERHAPCLILIDCNLPDCRGVAIVRELRRRRAATAAILMAANEADGLNELAREAGCRGTLIKTANGEELLLTMRTVVAGGTAFDRRNPRRAGVRALSPRECQVLQLVAAGRTNREIAEELGVGATTVKTMLTRLFMKLKVRRRAEAVAVGRELGVL